MIERPESSVSAGVDEYGELVFACDRHGPVIYRTPEELGVPRVVRDIPAPRKTLRPDWSAPSYTRQSPMRLARVKRDRRAQSISVPKKCEVANEHEEDGTVANDLKDRVLAEPDTPVKELMAKTGATKAQIYSWRYEARKKAGLVAAPKAARKAKAAPATLQRVAIDPQQPGTASALIGALARRDAASTVTVRLELTESEVAALVGKFSDMQRAAFLAGGVKAAILG